VVSGVGHEVDLTIADLAADVRAPTPSAAAEIVVPDGAEWGESLGLTAARLRRAMLRLLETRVQRLRWLAGRAEQVSPAAKLAQQAQRLDELEQRLGRGLRQLVAERRSHLGEWRTRLWQASPVAHLQAVTARQAALRARLRIAMLDALNRAREHYLPLVRTLHAVSPLATLERGYAIVRRPDGGVVRDPAEIPPGTEIEALLLKGRVRARVESS
jgi:exodeoxyribonuclease VII large subunit